MPIYEPPPSITFDGTKVFDGASHGASWADLDLSAVVGAKESLVFLKVVNKTGGTRSCAFRTNGDTDDYYGLVGGNGENNNRSDLADDQAMVVTLPTDSAGIIEWYSESAQNYLIYVLAYIQ